MQAKSHSDAVEIGRDSSIDQVVRWMRERFQQFENEEVDQNQFIEIMTASNQFRSKVDAQHYFELLDIDKNGNVSFTEFFAPLIPQLPKAQVMELTEDSTFQTADLSLLRSIYIELRQKSLQVPGGAAQSIKLQHIRAAVQAQKKDSLNRAFVNLVGILPESQRNGAISDEKFSQLLSTLEIFMIKKYCLRNYLDSYKEVINEYVVSLEQEKGQRQKGARPEDKNKIAKESDMQSEIEFVGKLKSFREQEYINIKNPEYILSLLAEDSLMYMYRKDESAEEAVDPAQQKFEKDQMVQVFRNILTAANQVSRKIQNMQTRLKLLES